MNNIIDVEYREVMPLEDKSVATLATEANELYARAESVAAVSMMMLVEAGKRLRIIKERVGHGGWGDWIKENLHFSQKKAIRMMNLAEKNEEEGGLFSNLSTLTNIEISKVWALLEAPEEVAKEALETAPVEDMTVKNLQEELKRIKEENKALSEASEVDKEKVRNLDALIRELRTDMEAAREMQKEAEEKLAAAPDSTELEEALEAAKKEALDLETKLLAKKQELKDFKSKVKADRDKEKEAIEAEAKEAARKELDDKAKEMNDRIQKAGEDARAQAAEKVEGLQREVERLRKMSDPAAGIFKAHVDSMQQEYNACLAAIEQAAPENQSEWKNALGQVIRAMEGQL